jgi:hypothetical protein
MACESPQIADVLNGSICAVVDQAVAELTDIVEDMVKAI